MEVLVATHPTNTWDGKAFVNCSHSGECIVGLNLNSLKTNDIDMSFLCQYAIHISSIVSTLTYFYGTDAFLLMSCKNSFCILETKSLLDIFLQILSSCLWLLFTLSSTFFEK